jgi:membrane glycosyltransferase
MSDILQVAPGEPPHASSQSLTTPTGLQANTDLRARRRFVLALNVVTYAALMAAMERILAAGGWTLVDGMLMTCFALGSPWTVLGFWNALIGLWLLNARRDRMQLVAPYAAAGDESVPLTIRTAILLTLRNEDAARAVRRLEVVKASLDATGEGAAFDYYVLSDTSVGRVADDEERAIAAWRARDGDSSRIHYRRRPDNKGFKAGNVRDFLERWGAGYELMLPLDADSLMTGERIVRLVRMMQAHPRIGILQSLVVGSPSESAFARVFQFGMRHGMRSYTMGQAWWVGDCGPYWGHNALVRVAPFRDQCDLPILPGKPPLGGHVLSHDQVEATLMRRAGFEVRVLPEEGGSYEENPPTALEFIRRDVRWCQGNMQYLRLLGAPGTPDLLPGLHKMSRFQLVWAILMFVGIPAWTLGIALLPVAAWQAQAVADFPSAWAEALYATFLVMFLAPKLAGLADAVLTRGAVAAYGGAVRFAAGAALEIAFAFLQGAVSSIRTSLFMAGLLVGKSVVWSGQVRDVHGLSWATAAKALWPQLVFGVAVCGTLAAVSPRVLAWSLPLTAGYLLAIPFAVLTASPRLGSWMKTMGLCALPEEAALPAELEAVQNLPDEPSPEAPLGHRPLGDDPSGRLW